MGNEFGRKRAFLKRENHIASANLKGKTGNNVKTKLLFSLLFLFFFSVGMEAYAQSPAMRQKAVEKKDSIVPFKSRWAIRTNAVDWLFLLPNVGAEFDLTSSPYNKMTVGLSAKWNWNTSQKYLPSTVYNLFDARVEVRRYWRTELKQNANTTAKAGTLRKIQENLFSKQRLHPRYWRAYYVGIYSNLANYSYKFGKEGVQGDAYGFGVSAGFGIPLYGYKNHFVDLELGGSVGCVFTKYGKYGYDAESNCYPDLPGKSKGWHVLPYPVITDLRVAFVYRFASIKDKYRLEDHVKEAARQARKAERKSINDSINEARRLKKEEKQVLKKKEQEEKKLEKDTKDKKANEAVKSEEPVKDKKKDKGKKPKKTKEDKPKKADEKSKNKEGGTDEKKD